MKTREIKQAIRTKFAWPGGYQLFGITSDGGTLCCDCMRQEYHQIAYAVRHGLSDGWRVTAIDSSVNLESEEWVKENPEDGVITLCDHCNAILNP